MMAFGFKKKLVPSFLREFYYLIFNRGTVARPNTLDLSRIERGFSNIRADCVMHLLIGVADVAGDLKLFNRFGLEGKWDWPLIWWLRLKHIPINCASVEAWWCPGF